MAYQEFSEIFHGPSIYGPYFMAPTPTYLMHSPLTYFWTKSEWSVHNFKSSNQSYSGNVKITFCRFLEIKTESIKKWHQYVNKIR